MGDLCSLTGYTRDQVRGLLDSLPPCGARSGRARAATSYSMQDLVLVALCTRLEQHYGMKREMVAALAPGLSAELEKRKNKSADRLLVRFDPPGAESVGRVDALEDGLVIALDPVFDLVDGYLLPAGGSRASHERLAQTRRTGKD